MGINVNAGNPIPLIVQLTGGHIDKIVKATVRKLSDNTIVGSQVICGHTQNGEYKNISINYPIGESHCVAQYLIFDSDGITPNTEGDKVNSSIFELSSTEIQIIHPSSFIQGIVYEEDNIEGVVSDSDNIVGEIQDDSTNITGTIASDDENIAGMIGSDEDNIIGIVEE